jgi:uncharacterized protein with HEPN domain
MRPEERDPASIWDMLEAARDAIRFVGELSEEEFTAGGAELVRSAVERQLEILGEAANRISASFRERHPEIPWRDLVGLRNVISHQYEKVDYKVIHRICRQTIPAVIEKLEALAEKPPTG